MVFTQTKIKNTLIINDYYLVTGLTPKQENTITYLAGYNPSLETKYSVLLPIDKNTTSFGNLMVVIPNNTSFIWKTIWPPLLTSILLISIISLGFIYLIRIIFKKI